MISFCGFLYEAVINQNQILRRKERTCAWSIVMKFRGQIKTIRLRLKTERPKIPLTGISTDFQQTGFWRLTGSMNNFCLTLLLDVIQVRDRPSYSLESSIITMRSDMAGETMVCPAEARKHGRNNNWPYLQQTPYQLTNGNTLVRLVGLAFHCPFQDRS
jgi:hypothetical protein